MRSHAVGAAFVLLLAAAASYACATVADLEVSRAPGDPQLDKDDPLAGQAEGGLEASAPEGGDAGNDAPSLPVPPQVCSCPVEQACCVPSAGVPVCAAASGKDTCQAGGGIFLRCAGGDIANGRECCFGQGSKETFYAASCGDAGQVCADPTECAAGTCQLTTCRGVSIGVCGPSGGTPFSCPP